MQTFIDLFCGIGGFRVALEKRGLQCVFSCDIDAHVQDAYRRNFGETPHGDITEISANKIPKHDVLCAGFPCQPFSISGNQRGILDPRGRLFCEIMRIAEYHKPSVLLLENVKNILTIDGGNVIKTIKQEINTMGYDLHTHVLNTSYFGIPQSRERVYFVAIRKNSTSAPESNTCICSTAPIETRKPIFLESVLEEDVECELIIRRNDMVITKDEDDIPYQLKPVRIGTVNKGGQGERIYSPKGHAITQSAYGGGVGARTGLYRTKQGVRRLTIRECKQVMGFSRDHHVSEGTQGYQQLGNAVVPAMVGYVYNHAFNHILERGCNDS